MAAPVSEVVVSSDQPAPSIRRESVGGVERCRGTLQPVFLLVPVGAEVTVEVKVDGVAVAALGPWTATALPGMNAGVWVGMQVQDQYPRDSLAPAPAEPEPL